MIHDGCLASKNHKKSFSVIILFLVSPLLNASCPATTPWSTAVNVSNSGCITSNIFSAGTSAGFMAVWVDSSNNAHYSFSSNGVTWQSGLVSASTGNVATNSDVFVAGNSTGFMVTWIDSANNGWSSFSTDNGTNWSSAIAINPNTLLLNANSDVYVAGGASGFVATMIGDDNNAYVSFSTGTATWNTPTQVTSDGLVYNINLNSETGRGFVSAVIVGTSCMLAWITQPLATYSAYFTSINPFSTTTPYPIAAIGFFESVPSIATLNGYFMTATRANENNGVTIFSTATTPANWALFSLFSSPFNTPETGPSIAANHAGFMSTWIVDVNPGDPGSPMWTFSNNNGFDWTPVCSILPTLSTTIGGPVGLSSNSQGFVATWLDSNNADAYVSFYSTPSANPTSNDLFVTLLEQKYGPLV